jgi:hypothetical protein
MQDSVKKWSPFIRQELQGRIHREGINKDPGSRIALQIDE